jgi:hypothetical protein
MESREEFVSIMLGIVNRKDQSNKRVEREKRKQKGISRPMGRPPKKGRTTSMALNVEDGYDGGMNIGNMTEPDDTMIGEIIGNEFVACANDPLDAEQKQTRNDKDAASGEPLDALVRDVHEKRGKMGKEVRRVPNFIEDDLDINALVDE